VASARFACRAASAVGLFISVSSPALAWQTTVHFDSPSDFIFAQVGTLKGPYIKLLPPDRIVEVKTCTHHALADCEVIWGGKEVWIGEYYLKNIDKTFMSSTSLKKIPSKIATSIAEIPDDTIVLIHNCKNEWCEVEWETKRGWVDENLLFDHSDIDDY
jgi:hypothetical protein